MEYYSALIKNTFESVLMRWMNLEPIIESEVSQKERQILYINAYIWTLVRWYWQSYMQGSKGDTEVKNRLLDSGKGEGGMIWENSIETCTLPYVEWMTSVSSRHEAGQSGLVLCDNLGMGWGGRWEGGSGWRVHMHTYGQFMFMYNKTITIL